MDLKLSGKRTAVAAASKGLGFGTAAALAAEGARVVICGRDSATVDAAVARLGPHAVGLVADVSTSAGASGFVSAAADALGGPLDILVTNGGGPPPGTFASTPFEQYAPALERSLLSVVAMCVNQVRQGVTLLFSSIASLAIGALIFVLFIMGTVGAVVVKATEDAKRQQQSHQSRR